MFCISDAKGPIADESVSKVTPHGGEKNTRCPQSSVLQLRRIGPNELIAQFYPWRNLGFPSCLLMGFRRFSQVSDSGVVLVWGKWRRSVFHSPHIRGVEFDFREVLAQF